MVSVPSLNRATLVCRPRAAPFSCSMARLDCRNDSAVCCAASLSWVSVSLICCAPVAWRVHPLVHRLEARRQGLHLVNDLGEVRADLADFLHPAAHFLGELVHAHDPGGHRRLHLLDHLLDVVGGDARSGRPGGGFPSRPPQSPSRIRRPFRLRWPR